LRSHGITNFNIKNMNRLFFPTFLLIAFLFSSCFNKVEPEVSTVYVKSGDKETERSEAVSTLFEHYSKSSKDKQYYEVLSKKDGRFILNYNRIDQRLTICTDPGSGWSRQYVGITDADLEDLLVKGLSFNDLDFPKDPVIVDEVTLIVKEKELKYTKGSEMIIPKTNGKPSGY
jgi:hypothetical protein